MQKNKFNIVALLLLGLAGLVVVPGGIVSAAFNNVTYPAAFTIVLTGPDPDITLTVSSGANVNQLLVFPSSVQVRLERDANGVSSIVFTSAEKYNLNNDGSFAVTCGATTSSVTFTGPAAVSTVTNTLTPSLTTCGGGGGVSPAPAPAPSPAT